MKPNEFLKIYNSFSHPEEKRILLKQYCLINFQFFCKFFFKDHVGHSWNDMHKDFFKDDVHKKRDVNRLILASRGASKTTLVALLYVLHRVCFAKDPYILILSSTAPLARQKTATIVEELENNKELIYTFGLRFKDKRRSKEQFKMLSDYGESYIHSQGFMSQIRGAKTRANRPTLIICDDILNSENVFAEEQRDKMRRQFFGDLKMAKAPETNTVVIGTILHKDDLMSELSKSPTWKSTVYKAIKKWPKNMHLWDEWESILKNIDDPNREKKADKFYKKNKRAMNVGAKVLWPDRESLLALMKLRLEVGKRVFNCEKQLEAFSSAESLFTNITWFVDKFKDGERGFYIEKTGEWIDVKDSRWQQYYALDPATGEKSEKSKNLSMSSRIVVYRDIKTNRLFITKDWTDRQSPTKIIEQMYSLQQKYFFVRMGVEENLFQDLYAEAIELIRFKLQKEKNRIINKLPIFGIWQRDKKEQRIYGIEPKVSSGHIVFSRHLSADARTQLEDYPICSNNDFLDAVEIADKLTNKKYKIKPMNLKL